MDNKQVEDIEIKFSIAVTMFAVSCQKIMENSARALGEIIESKAKENPDLTVDEMAKEISKHVVKEISKQFKLK